MSELVPYVGVVYVEERQLFYIVTRSGTASGDRFEFDLNLPSAATKSRIVHWRVTKIDESVVHGAGLLNPTKETIRVHLRHTVYFGPSGRVPVKLLPD